MTAKKSRQQYIDILVKRNGSNKQHKAFLESLTLNELASMVDSEGFEDEFELEGEIRDLDFDEQELDFN